MNKVKLKIKIWYIKYIFNPNYAYFYYQHYFIFAFLLDIYVTFLLNRIQQKNFYRKLIERGFKW